MQFVLCLLWSPWRGFACCKSFFFYTYLVFCFFLPSGKRHTRACLPALTQAYILSLSLVHSFSVQLGTIQCQPSSSNSNNNNVRVVSVAIVVAAATATATAAAAAAVPAAAAEVWMIHKTCENWKIKWNASSSSNSSSCSCAGEATSQNRKRNETKRYAVDGVVS